MRIQLVDPDSTDDLVAFMRKVGCLAVRIDRNTVDAHLLNSVSERYDTQEITAYLKVWQTLQPDSGAVVVAS